MDDAFSTITTQDLDRTEEIIHLDETHQLLIMRFHRQNRHTPGTYDEYLQLGIKETTSEQAPLINLSPDDFNPDKEFPPIPINRIISVSYTMNTLCHLIKYDFVINYAGHERAILPSTITIKTSTFWSQLINLFLTLSARLEA